MAMSLRGINSNNVATVQDAVEEYKKSIDNVLDKIVNWENTEYQKALKGDSQVTTIKEYVDGTIEEMKKMTSFIDEFKDGISEVASNYVSQTDAVSTAAVSEATVANEGDLTGVQPF